MFYVYSGDWVGIRESNMNLDMLAYSIIYTVGACAAGAIAYAFYSIWKEDRYVLMIIGGVIAIMGAFTWAMERIT